MSGLNAVLSSPLAKQVGRFARVWAATAVSLWVAGGELTTRDALVGVAVGAAEVAYRQVRQVRSGPAPSSATPAPPPPPPTPWLDPEPPAPPPPAPPPGT